MINNEKTDSCLYFTSANPAINKSFILYDHEAENIKASKQERSGCFDGDVLFGIMNQKDIGIVIGNIFP